MVYCPNCGKQNDNSNFCTSCGQKLEVMNTNQDNNMGYQQQTQNMGIVNIYRSNNFVGVLVPFDIFVDGYFMGTVANDTTTQLTLYYGMHTIEIKQGFNKSAIQQILVNEQNRIINMTVSMEMGVWQNKLIISNIVVGC